MYRVNTIMYSTWYQWKGLLNAKSLLRIVPMVHKCESPICSSPMLQVNCIIVHNADLTPPLPHLSDPTPPIPLIAGPKNSTCTCDTQFSQASKDDISTLELFLVPYCTIPSMQVTYGVSVMQVTKVVHAVQVEQIVKWCNWSLWYSFCKAFL
jgi:hypothetical protein